MTPWIATEADIPVLVERGRKFYDQAPHKPVGRYDTEAIERVLRFLIVNPDGLVLMNDYGGIGGLVAPVFFDPSKRLMEIQFWSFRRGGRAALQQFEHIAREMGATACHLSTFVDDRTRASHRAVTAMGYHPVERRYLKELI